MELLKKLCSIHAPSGEEYLLRDFLIEYIQTESKNWKAKPELFYGDGFKDCLILIFGKPEISFYAHMDSIGFTVRYNRELIPIGSPEIRTGISLVGKDKSGYIECITEVLEDNKIQYIFNRNIKTGTSLTYRSRFIATKDFIESNYLDNRLGIRNLLDLAEIMENGAIIFSTGEEHGGGSVEFIARFLYENYKITKAIISDVTWASEGVFHGQGVVISLRDKMIPRRQFVDQIITIADKNKVKYQLEVESSGSSDGGYLHKVPYPVDWCFIGPAASNVHSPHEKVHKKDIIEMEKLYKALMSDL